MTQRATGQCTSQNVGSARVTIEKARYLVSGGACSLNPTQKEFTLTFNGGNSTSDMLTTLDGLGRTHVQQTRQGPSSTTFDSVETDYDSIGRVSKVTLLYSGSAGQTNSTIAATTTTYDALSRPLSVADGGGGSITYSYGTVGSQQNDILVTQKPAPTGENTKARQLESDGLGRLTSICEVTAGTTAWPGGACGQHTAQTGYLTNYTYDPMGNLLTVTQNAQAASNLRQARSFTYDWKNRMLSETVPEIGATGNGTVTYRYDSANIGVCNITSKGDLIMRTDASGVSTCNGYDAMHRLLSVGHNPAQANSTPDKFFVYDAATVNGVAMANPKGRLVEAYTCMNPCTKLTDEGFSYSVRGEQSDLYELTPHSGTNYYYHTAQTYWPHGLPNQLSSNISGLPSITYGGTIGSTAGLDGEGRITQVTASSGQNPVTAINYNPFGTPPQLIATFGSGDSDVFSFDANTGRTTKYQFNVNGQSDVGTLTWNSNGSLKQLAITDALNSSDSQTCTYSHDDLSRIASINCGASIWQQNFGYDPFGNITKTVPIGGTGNSFQPSYNSATNRMSSVAGFTPTYDANGNTITDPSYTYTWDADGHPLTINGVGLTYDALGRMVEQNRSGTYTEIAYSPTGGKLALLTGQTLQKGLVLLPGGGEAVYNASGLLYYGHSDHLGSMRLGSSPSRTVYFDLAHAPFGEIYASSGGSNVDPAFTGQRQDTVSGLFDFPAREYSNEGRWHSPDPAGRSAASLSNPQSWNRYAYVLNNPLSSVDPQGFCGEDDGGFDDESSCDDVGEPDSGGGPVPSPPSAPCDPAVDSCPSTACTSIFDACTPGSLNAGAQPNLAGMFNEGPGGYSYGGVDALVALGCAAANDPSDPGCWGVKLSLNGGLLQGSWSLQGYADAAFKPLKYLFQVPGVPPFIPPLPLATPDPLDPDKLVSFRPNPLPNPTSRSYVCPALVTEIRQLQLQSVGNPSIVSQLAALQAMYQKSCN